MASEKGATPRFYVASKIRNMVKNIAPAGGNKQKPGPEPGRESRDDNTIHSFHISESQQKPFMDCDGLFSECEEFIKVMHRTIEMNSKGKTGLSKFVSAIPISDKVQKWRSKKKGQDLHEAYENIQTRVDHMDTTLNEIADVSATTTSALITQSVHLNNRLTSCVDYNRTEVDKNKQLVVEGRTFVNKLKSMEKSIVAMIDFLDEVEELKRTEPKPYIPWALRQQYEDDAEEERKAAKARNEMVELKKESLERRLRKIRKVLEPVEKLSRASEQAQHIRLDNLSHCLRSQLALLNFLHRCQTSSGAGGSIQGLVNAASTSSASPNTPPPPPPATASPQSAHKTSAGGGFMNFANPIKAKTTSAPNSGKGTAQAYKPTLAELAAGIVPGAPRLNSTERLSETGSNPSSARNSEAGPGGSGTGNGTAPSMTTRTSSSGGLLRGATAAPENGSFDHDSESDGDDDDDEHADDPANPDNAIEKAVRHMRVALATLQRNSGLVLEKLEPYDHSNCSDCAVVYDMANDCCMHIAAANFRSKQCAERLLRLNTYKDRMKENAEQLDAQEPA